MLADNSNEMSGLIFTINEKVHKICRLLHFFPLLQLLTRLESVESVGLVPTI